MKIIITVLLATLLFSCVTQKKCYRRYPPQITRLDSIVLKDTIFYTDTSVLVNGDSVVIVDSIPCPEATLSKTAKSVSGKISASVNVSNGKLFVRCESDSLKIVIHNLKTQIKTLEKYASQTTTVPSPPVTKYKTPPWAWYLLGVFVVVVVVKAIQLVIKLKSF